MYKYESEILPTFTTKNQIKAKNHKGITSLHLLFHVREPTPPNKLATDFVDDEPTLRYQLQ